MTSDVPPIIYRFVFLILIRRFHRPILLLAARVMDRVLPFSPSRPFDPISPKQPSPSSPSHSSSPRFPSLHRRLRSTSSTVDSSNPAPALPDPAPDTTAYALALRNEGVRAAKSLLLATTRDDWSYPENDDASAEKREIHEALDFRYREESSSDADQSDGPPMALDTTVIEGREQNPYKFESPDTVATSVWSHRRKRRRLLTEESEWNAGLSVWVQRRDAWTGAVSEQPAQRQSTKELSPDHENKLNENGIRTDNLNRRNSFDGTSNKSTLPPTPPHSRISNSSATSESVRLQVDYSRTIMEDVLLPIFPPLVPSSNPVKASIRPSTYPSIYGKVVIQGLKPTIPIPLPDMVKALVQGWKGEGHWPPRSSEPIANESAGGLKLGLPGFRSRRLEGDKSRVRRSVGAVRKVLGLGSAWSAEHIHQKEDPALDGFGIDFEEQKSVEVEDVLDPKELMPDNG